MSMHPVLVGQEPKVALLHFSELLGIPRPSGKEEGVREFVRKWATGLGYRTTVDNVGNIVTHVPATPGYEDAPFTCMQGHMDMVYAPAFNAESIDVEVDGDWLQTKGKTRTLGADNAAALVLAMDAAETLPHGPLELLFTADEEDSLGGAEGFKPSNHDMKSRFLVNIDTPEFRRIAVMSAGFQYVNAAMALSRDVTPSQNCYRLSLKGLAGGHSGDHVGLNRGNAIKTIGELIMLLPSFGRLVSIKGGAAGNSIPADAEAVVSVSESFDQELWSAPLFRHINQLRDALVRPEVQLTIDRVDGETLYPLEQECSERLLRLLRNLPSGVLEWSSIPQLPELSTTLATLKEDSGVLKIVQIVRGATEEGMKSLTSSLQGIFKDFECVATLGHHTGGWKQLPGSPLVAATLRGFEKIGQPAELKGYHCGLELAALIGNPSSPNFDAAVSLGCQVDNEHGVDERMSLNSMREIRNVLGFLLLEIAEGKVA